MIKFIKEKIKEWKFKRELKKLVKLPVMVVETTVYVEKTKQPKKIKIQKKVKRNAKKRG